MLTNREANETYVLYQCGTQHPNELPPGTIPNVPANAKVFEIPLVSVSVADTTANTFLVGGPWGDSWDAWGQGHRAGGRGACVSRGLRPPLPPGVPMAVADTVDKHLPGVCLEWIPLVD